MPATSKAQLRWVNSPGGRKALGDAGVKEWDQASKGLKLPERVSRVSKKPKKSRRYSRMTWPTTISKPFSSPAGQPSGQSQ